MPDKIEFIVNEEESGLRLDLFLVGRLPRYSRNYLKLLINRKKVSVNNDHAKPHHRVNTGEQVTIIMPPVPPQSPRPEPIPLDIIHEDDAIIVINKSPGISVHPETAVRRYALWPAGWELQHRAQPVQPSRNHR